MFRGRTIPDSSLDSRTFPVMPETDQMSSKRLLHICDNSVLYCVTWFSWRGFPESPSLYDSGLELTQREIGQRFGRWKLSDSHYFVRVIVVSCGDTQMQKCCWVLVYPWSFPFHIQQISLSSFLSFFLSPFY